ncbi:sodium:sulfate symporter family protein [Hyphomonas neptunium ATCC 15444]|uniref:Sodium:sulfate symporter family protein n=2 Tax=Hyphomonas TaxID=85 RepID=Q0C3K5_HYPNA|nr:sodium:sulfate symporter family protein [Hyphomonas neptunium ATCC 15444]KCZ96101.1 sodium:sulfate symporter family protein [Hyphomonas hirschiana VP5]
MSNGDRQTAVSRPGLAARLGLVIGPALAILIAVLPAPEGLERGGMLVAAVLVLMAVWWATEAIPIAATSLLPLGLLPLTGVASLGAIAAPYADSVVLLLLGGFIMAIGIEKWHLHRRIALNVLLLSGARLKLLAGGFMLATALLSMWISNTATSLMMAPIALSVAVAAGGGPRLASALLLGIAYSASIGGLATPVGTPTNLIAMGWLRENTDIEISFREWMSFGLPVVLIMLPMAWLILTWGLKSDAAAAKAAEATIRGQRNALGRMTIPESRVAIVFGVIALAWITREQLVQIPLFAGLTDMGIAILGAILMFLVPHGSREPEHQPGGWALLNWDDAKAVPWDVVLLFGGGLSLAAAVQASGLAGYLGNSLAELAAVPPIVLIFMVVTIIIFLTEIMSNVAAMTTFLPILGALATATGVDVRSLIIPCAMAASCAFMLPIATGPNAVVFGMRQFSIGRMMKSGFWLNVACVIIVTLYFGL